MKSQVEWHFVFIVVGLGLVISAAIVIFWNWIASQKQAASEFSCRNKYENYCIRWLNQQRDPGDWDTVPPKPEDCVQFNIAKPASLDECREMVGG